MIKISGTERAACFVIFRASSPHDDCSSFSTEFTLVGKDCWAFYVDTVKGDNIGALLAAKTRLAENNQPHAEILNVDMFVDNNSFHSIHNILTDKES